MLDIWTYAILSVLLISIISLIGAFFLSIKEAKLRKLLIYFVSFAAGALLGDAFIHLLPEVIEEIGFTLQVSLFILFGIGFGFIVEKFIHWRHCHIPTSEEHPHPVAFMNLVGDAVHNFIDGIIIGASYLASIPAGIATTIAVVLHEIPQEIGDFAVLLHGGYTRKKALFYNFLIALTSILGAVIALLLGSYVENIILYLLPFAAGTFIYIAGSDLIPELQKHTRNSRALIQLLMLVLGVLVMLSLLLLE